MKRLFLISLAAFCACALSGRRAPPGLDGFESESALLRSLRDESAAVRGEAALAFFRRRYLKRVPGYSAAAARALQEAMRDPDPGVRWKAVYAFSRWEEPRAKDALIAAVADAEPYVRLFALRSLGQFKSRAPMEPLMKALKDEDAQVRREAAWALGEAGRREALAAVVRDPSPHVRAAAAAAGAAVPLDDPSPLVRANAGDPRLRRRDPHWFVRAGALRALTDRAMLQEGLADPDPRAASAALEAIAKSTEAWAAAAVEAVLRDPGAPLEMIGTAVDAAGERKSAKLLESLGAALDNPAARSSPEVREGILKAIDDTLALHPRLKTAAWTSRLSVSSAAAQSYWGDGTTPKPAPAAVVLVTEKGEIEISLAVREAPIHSQRFLISVSSGLYDGTIWHRVVSNFVIQGGDPRGSGWGDAGFTLRDEINGLRFERGTVGMPKAGKDTGGCQLFITHVPTPHLDGRYTAFGRVVRGLDVVDRIEPGDRILRAYVKMLE